jgi:hypothetical protein
MRSKYGSVKFKYNGRVFDSKKEAKRYAELLLLRHANIIKELQLQKRFVLQQWFKDKWTQQRIREIVYICDFFYYDTVSENYVVEDVKGYKTELYKLKKKLFMKKFGDQFEFREV